MSDMDHRSSLGSSPERSPISPSCRSVKSSASTCTSMTAALHTAGSSWCTYARKTVAAFWIASHISAASSSSTVPSSLQISSSAQRKTPATAHIVWIRTCGESSCARSSSAAAPEGSKLRRRRQLSSTNCATKARESSSWSSSTRGSSSSRKVGAAVMPLTSVRSLSRRDAFSSPEAFFALCSNPAACSILPRSRAVQLPLP
mmetsp:Transcript_16305/g.39382  ORF Transcript_16305/g.39382 Transcript_16305/m.39382 type:complete len:202 (-) Transcript_16305:157-762(-)